MSKATEEQALSATAFAAAEGDMHKGRAGSLIMLACVGVALLGGLAFLVGGEDQARVYGEIGKQINGLKHGNFDQFWACALQGQNVVEIKSNADLATQVGGRGQERGRKYGVHVREKCLPKLEDVGPKLDTLIAPQDLASDVAALKKANAELRSAWSGYIAYLDDPELQYDEDKAKPNIDSIAHAWFDFVTAHGAINKTIKGKIK
jgi:hypothetical protein